MGGRGASSTGYNYSDYQSVVRKWVNDMDHITPREKNVLESFIVDSVKNKGPVSSTYGISRGLSMTNNELNNLKVGETFAEGKLTSWSSRVGIAQSFARENTSTSKPNKVIIRTKSPSSQAAKLTGITNLSKYSEAEAIMSSKAKFKIEKIKIDKKNYSEVWVKPIN